jgi:flagella basal body P-ring formation protein FlgA
MRRLILVATIAFAGHAEAATLRTVTTLHSSSVYLRDLFDDAGRNANMRLGPGPEPGGRIEVPAAQLDAIARQYGVAWRSVSSGDVAVLEWPGWPMRREDAIQAVRLAVTAAGAQDDTDIDLPGFTPPVVPTDTPTSATVSQLDLDRASGRFTAMLTVSGDGMNPISIRISGQLEEMVQVPVAMTRLLADTVIHPSDIHMTRVRASLVQNDSARTEAQLIGMQTKRQLAAGVPLRLADLMRPPMVQRGELVDVELDSPGLSVHGKAVAVDAGADGERVRIQAQASKNFLTAQVVGPHMVRVTPDIPLSDQSIPTRFDRRTTQP